MEVEDLQNLSKPIAKASIHEVITSISPIKKGRKANYFEGTISDGSGKARLVGFNSAQQKLSSSHRGHRIGRLRSEKRGGGRPWNY